MSNGMSRWRVLAQYYFHRECFTWLLGVADAQPVRAGEARTQKTYVCSGLNL